MSVAMMSQDNGEVLGNHAIATISKHGQLLALSALPYVMKCNINSWTRRKSYDMESLVIKQINQVNQVMSTSDLIPEMKGKIWQQEREVCFDTLYFCIPFLIIVFLNLVFVHVNDIRVDL